MDRLTKRGKDGTVFIDKKGFNPCNEFCHADNCNYCITQKAFTKLAHYEDLEEQGGLIVLPCAVGSLIYFILENGEIDSQLIDNVQTALFFKDINGNLIRGFYLTKEEAEAKLRELNTHVRE